MKQPLISIIVPVYKVEKYLGKCIESILAQTYKNIEVILVDDGSPDSCPAICDRYADKDNRVVVIHKQNGGLSDARNAGLDIARGDFISFVDSDDFVANNFCEVLLKAINKENADLAVCNYLRVDENYNLIQEKNMELPFKNECITSEKFMQGYFGKCGWYYVVVWNKLYKKSLFNNLRFPYGKQHEDEFLIHHFMIRCKKIACIENALYYYVQRGNSIISQKSIKNMDLGDALIEQYKFAKKNKLSALKNYAVRRLSFKMEEWKPLCVNDERAKQKYNELRKKAFFLVFEKSAWEGYTFSARMYYKITILSPKFSYILRKMKHI